MEIIKYILGAILIISIKILLSALILWGVGNLIIFVFKINYDWTILHGLASSFIYDLLKEIFSGNINKGEN